MVEVFIKMLHSVLDIYLKKDWDKLDKIQVEATTISTLYISA